MKIHHIPEGSEGTATPADDVVGHVPTEEKTMASKKKGKAKKDRKPKAAKKAAAPRNTIKKPKASKKNGGNGKAEKAHREKKAVDDTLCTFAIRIPRAESEAIHAQAGPRMASVRAREVLAAFAAGDVDAFKAVLKTCAKE